ncbi:MAG TPA: cation:proton antiporter [Longimicrobiaceae bacterium]|nr:cation:proton antiporter [Longimicrobiaceae bacterium]
MRRLFILALLLGGMQLIFPLGSQGRGSQALLSFGFLILAAYTVGELATTLRLPKIVGYLVAGVVFGPYVLGTVTVEGAQRLAPVSQLAIALIAFLAGAELRWGEVKERGPLLLKMMSAELVVAFTALFGLLYGFRDFVPFLSGAPDAQVLAFALLFAAIAIVHSPAVTMALLTETGARGPVTRTTLGIVLLSDVAVVLFFSAALAVARALVPPSGAAGGTSVLLVLWEIGGALLVGALLGGVVALYLRYVGRELVFFAILVAFFGLEIARLAHVEVLLTLLVAGFVTENVSREGEGEELLHAMERSAAPVFVVFFALSGAKIQVAQVAALLPLVIPLALVRAGAIWAGMRLGGRWAGAGEPERKYAWMGLISQAGVAIGLATIVTEAYPEQGAALGTLLLALIAVNETVGPILFRRAIYASGEAAPESEGAKPASGARAAASH